MQITSFRVGHYRNSQQKHAESPVCVAVDSRSNIQSRRKEEGLIAKKVLTRVVFSFASSLSSLHGGVEDSTVLDARQLHTLTAAGAWNSYFKCWLTFAFLCEFRFLNEGKYVSDGTAVKDP